MSNLDTFDAFALKATVFRSDGNNKKPLNVRHNKFGQFNNLSLGLEITSPVLKTDMLRSLSYGKLVSFVAEQICS